MTVMLVDDDVDTATLLGEALGTRGYPTDVVHSGEACLERLRVLDFDVVVTDVQMGGMSGIELCERIHAQHRDIPVIVLTGAGSLETAIEAIRAGAFDFVTKPVKSDVLAIAVKRALDHHTLRREVKRLRVATAITPGSIVGTSEPIMKTKDMIARVADSDATVLITGESGTGKELVARALHDQSARRGQPFVAINCAAMPPALLESELFGHVRGAFTDAHSARQGLFVQAQRGTIFLDEVGEMPLEMQVKLLRVLQQRTVRAVGGDVEAPIHARVITATNRNLEREVEEKRFREDLFYRINVVPLAVPPLRDRSTDILILAQHFLKRAGARAKKDVRGISTPAAQRLLDHDWPGNVRELENWMERAVALCRLDEITIDDLPLREVVPTIMTASLDELTTLDEMERRYVRQALAFTKGNKSQAAKLLGIDRRSLYRRLEGAPPDETPEP